MRREVAQEPVATVSGTQRLGPSRNRQYAPFRISAILFPWHEPRAAVAKQSQFCLIYDKSLTVLILQPLEFEGNLPADASS